MHALRVRIAMWLGAQLLASAVSAQSQTIDFEDFEPGTTLFEQMAGLRFPETPRITVTSQGTSSGNQALTNRDPGDEFDVGPLVVEFLTPQRFVRLRAGVDGRSDNAVPATLRAFDRAGNLVGQTGPIAIGPGPTAITTPMAIELSSATIRRIELHYEISFFEVIDDLEFSTAGPQPPPDTVPPEVTLLQPADGSVVTGRAFILEAAITEDRLLREVRLEIANDRGGSQTVGSGGGEWTGRGLARTGCWGSRGRVARGGRGGPSVIRVRYQGSAAGRRWYMSALKSMSSTGAPS